MAACHAIRAAALGTPLAAASRKSPRSAFNAYFSASIEHKNPELAMKLEHTPEWETMSLNHLEGRTAGFFCYGDGGGDELDREGRPKLLKHKHYFNPEDEPFENDREAYAPLVWQCRYACGDAVSLRLPLSSTL